MTNFETSVYNEQKHILQTIAQKSTLTNLIDSINETITS